VKKKLAVAGLVVVLVQKAREQDDAIRRTFEKTQEHGGNIH